MTTTIEIKLQNDLLAFVERYAKGVNRKREEIIAEALKLLRTEWELEKGYFEDKEESLLLAESALPLFQEVGDEPSKAR